MQTQDCDNKCKQIAEKWHDAYDNSTMTKEQVDKFTDDCNNIKVLIGDVIRVLNKYDI